MTSNGRYTLRLDPWAAEFEGMVQVSRWLLAAGVAWTGSFMCLLGVAPNYPGLFAIVFFTGVGTAAFHPIASMGVAQASGTQRGLGMSLFSVGGNLGFAVGPIAAAWLMVQFGLPGTVAIVFPCLTMAVVLHASRGQFAVQLAPQARARRYLPSPSPGGGSAVCVHLSPFGLGGTPGSSRSSRCSCASRATRWRLRVAPCLSSCSVARSEGWLEGTFQIGSGVIG